MTEQFQLVSLNINKRCSLRCAYCHKTGTPILMADLIWKPIEQVKKGDLVFGLTQKRKRGHWSFTPTKVIATGSRVTETHRIKTDKIETVCSVDHKWLRTDSKYHAYRPCRDIKFISQPEIVRETEDYKRGWLCGMILGDGCLVDKHYSYPYQKHCHRYSFRLVLKDREGLERFEAYLPNIRFNHFMFKCDCGPYPAIEIGKNNDVKKIEEIS